VKSLDPSTRPDSLFQSLGRLYDIVMNMSMPGYKGDIDWSFPLGKVMQPFLTTKNSTFLIPVASTESCLDLLQFASALRHIRTLVGLPDSLDVGQERRKMKHELELTKERIAFLENEIQEQKVKQQNSYDALKEECRQLRCMVSEKDQELDQCAKEQQQWQEERKQLELEKNDAGVYLEQQARWELERERFETLLRDQQQRFQLDMHVARLQETKTKTEKALVEEQLRMAQTQNCNSF
jgi:hypothetical protein